MPLPTSIHYHFHKLAPDAEVLYVWIDSNRANTSDQGTLVETITSHDATLAFRHYAVKARSGKSVEIMLVAVWASGTSLGKLCFALSFEKAW
jgi:hypothetical protein